MTLALGRVRVPGHGTIGSMHRRSSGFSAIEILIACCLLTAAFIPVYALMQQNQTDAYLNELHVLGRRKARRVFSYLMGHPYDQIKARATGAAPPTGVPGLPEEGAEIDVPLPTGVEEALLLDAPEGQLESYIARIDKMETHCYFHELEAGLGRLAVHVQWTDPVSNEGRFYVGVRLIEDPFHWRQR